MKMLISTICVLALSPMALTQEKKPLLIPPAEAKNHIGETATVCGKVVDTKIPKYGLSGRGKPVFFNVDQPEPNPVFEFIAFGTKDGGPQEAIDAYKGKTVCVTGMISQQPSGPASILVSDRAVIKVTPDAK